MGAVFIGNFVNDIIVRCVGDDERVSYATGGSVTYGSLAAVHFGCQPPPRIVSSINSFCSNHFTFISTSFTNH